ncbi:MAG: histidine biosynthesis protein [Methylobacteriaceae bacterium]|nr:histidine biosynthesis protein [Methylobacteriaceae bacterium]
MEIIPVIDLKGGVVVHAKHGERGSYRPIVSRLASSSAAHDVLSGLLRLHPFKTVYVADLDAIEDEGDHSQLVSELARAHPSIAFWLDAGMKRPHDNANIRHVLGSESMKGDKGDPIDAATILSLDFRGDDFIGPLSLLERPAHWPDRVIVMTLARVGSGAGPDLARLTSIKQHAGARRVYAAGGVRNRSDLEALKDAGMAGVLVASALHDGRLSPADLAHFA